jgi:hypothetical protein
MKQMIALISLIATAAVTTYGYEELRNYTMNEGQTFHAVVISCDSQQDAVELLTADGYSVYSSFSAFTEEDSAYLLQREMAELFMSPTNFVIIPTHTVTQKWAGEEQSEGRVESVAGVSEHQYYLTLYNLGGVALENITLSYRIIYTQSGSFSEEIPNSTIENEVVTLSKVADGVIPVARLGAQEWKVYSTRAAIIVDDDTGSSSSYMVITVSMESVDGSTLTREIELPVYKSAVSMAD